MHEQQINFKNGLVDPNVLLEFTDVCHCPDLTHPRQADSHWPEYHHLYFPRQQYRGDNVSMSIRRLRNSPYNLIQMFSCQEDLYHQKTALEVPQRKIDLDAAATFLEEADVLTDYAATSWHIAETMNSLQSYRRGFFPFEEKALLARLAILGEMREEEQKNVAKLEIIEPIIVIGALRKYLIQQPEEGMQSFVDNLTINDDQALPPKIYIESHLRHRSKERLYARTSGESWILRRLVTQPATVAA